MSRRAVLDAIEPDPVARIPEFKYCAERVVPGGEAPVAASFGGGQLMKSAD